MSPSPNKHERDEKNSQDEPQVNKTLTPEDAARNIEAAKNKSLNVDAELSDANKTIDSLRSMTRAESSIKDTDPSQVTKADMTSAVDQTTEMADASRQIQPEIESKSSPIEARSSAKLDSKVSIDQGPKSDQPDITDATLPSLRSSSGVADVADVERTSDSKAGASKTDRPQITGHNVERTIASRRTAAADTGLDDFLTRSSGGESGPKTIGRYEIKRLLGEGSFGRVYEAHDPQLDRRVAIKVAKAISGATQLKRFKREARAAAQLRHPNIIPVYEYGEIEKENTIVYQFVAGETLKSFIKRQKNIPLDHAIEIIRQIADGLHYAHEIGIIHRDMKPDNVLIANDGVPHIADFGCARSMADDTNLTVDGSILGTPMYMSPEQASGSANTADGRTDIWSIGVMLFEMVAGERPFGGSLNDLLYAICNEDAKLLRKVRPDAPPDIETICEKCLTRDLDQRMSSARLLADELSRYQRGEPILSRPIGPLQRTWLWAKRNQAVASLLATVAVTLLIGSIVSTSFAFKAYHEQRVRAFAQLNALKTADGGSLGLILDDLENSKSTILPELNRQLKSEQATPQEQRRLRMAHLKFSSNAAENETLAADLVTDLLSADADDFHVCRELLEPYCSTLTSNLWEVAQGQKSDFNAGQKFRAAAALALFDPQSTNWRNHAADVAGYLTSLNQIEMAPWLKSLRPIREFLQPSLVANFKDRSPAAGAAKEKSAAILARLFDDQPNFLATLVPAADARQLPLLIASLQLQRDEAIKLLQKSLESLRTASNTSANPDFEQSIREQSNSIIALIQLGDKYQWEQFRLGQDPSVVTRLIEELGPAETPFDALSPFIEKWQATDPDLLAGILLALGQYQPNQLLASQKSKLQPILLDIFSEAASSRVHSSARWLLSQWGENETILSREKQLRRQFPDPGKDWHVDLYGNTFAIFGPVEAFGMGLDKSLHYPAGFRPSDVVDEPLHRIQLPRRFGLCTTEVTQGQFADFETDWLSQLEKKQRLVDEEIASTDKPDKAMDKQKKVIEVAIKNTTKSLQEHLATPEQPVNNINHFGALAYCRWLNDQQQLKGPIPPVEYLRRTSPPPSNVPNLLAGLDDPGYRLPTASEWEFSLRLRTRSLYPFGQSTEFADKYCRVAMNSNAMTHPVAQLKPGNSGLFDQLGNVREWCLDFYIEDLPKLPPDGGRSFYVDGIPEFESLVSLNRECRGGSFEDKVTDLRSTKRFIFPPALLKPSLGFRLARTYDGH